MKIFLCKHFTIFYAVIYRISQLLIKQNHDLKHSAKFSNSMKGTHYTKATLVFVLFVVTALDKIQEAQRDRSK